MDSRLKSTCPEVIYSDGGFIAVDEAMILHLKDAAQASARRRCRLCFHASPEATQHEMLIVMHRSAYIRPHRHIGRAETLTVIEGTADALLCDASGSVRTVIAMSPAAEGGSFFYRMPEGMFHTLIFRSEWLVFLETTIGPFDRRNTEMAAWSPSEADAAAGLAFLSQLSLSAVQARAARGGLPCGYVEGGGPAGRDGRDGL